MEPPLHFCWTKYGTEAGEGIGSILRRKEEERLASGGVFLWGIGNSVGPSIESLLEVESQPEVVFTPMLTRAAAKDESPAAVGRWTSAVDLSGRVWELPADAVVTSGIGQGRRIPRRHYALVCERVDPLVQGHEYWLDDLELANLRSGRPVGASQVTSVVRRVQRADRRNRYSVMFRASLVSPYVVTLGDWVPLPSPADLVATIV